MGMQRGMYTKLEGYESLKPLFEGSDREILAALDGKPALIRVPAASTEPAPKGRFISCLLHGNEPSGFQAMVEVLRLGERFPFDLWVLIGNVRAATEKGLYAHRHLDDQEDFNRVWGPDPATDPAAASPASAGAPSTELRRCATAILDELRSARLEAAVDLHNNSARNPYYAILPQISPEAQRLAALCADTVLHWGLPLQTLMEALTEMCPAVAVECGAGEDSNGKAFAATVVDRFLSAKGFSEGDLPDLDRPSRLVEVSHRVAVRPEVRFVFGSPNGTEPDLVIEPELDLYNFEVLPAGRSLGQVRSGASMPLVATDMAGRDVTGDLFRITSDGSLVPAVDVMPVMMTTTVQQTRRDCLFYMVSAIA